MNTNNNFTKQFGQKVSMVLLVFSMILVGCSDDEAGWADQRYLQDYELFVYHTNPNTGVEYTAEELAELSYDPRERESYTEGQQIDLSLVTSKRPLEIKVVSGNDLSVLETISTFEPFGEKFKSSNFSSSLDGMGLKEVGDKMGLNFEVLYEDGSIGAAPFVVGRVKVFDPVSANYFVYLKKSTGETVGLLTDESVTAIEKNAEVGSIVSFNGTSDKVEVVNIPDLDFRYTGDFSVGVWVNTTATNSDPSIIGDKDWGGGGNPGFVFAYTGGTWKLNAGDGSNRIDIDGNSINDGIWHFLVATFDRDGNATVYEDGTAIGSADISGFGTMESGYPIRLAQDGTGAYGSYYEGNLGETYIYDYVLTPEQVAGISSPSTGAQLRKQDGSVVNLAVTADGGMEATSEEGRFTYTFDGVDDRVALSNVAELDFRHAEDFSVALWVNTTATNSDPSIIGDKDWGSGGNPGFVFAFLGTNWKLNAGDGADRIDMDGSIINDGEWHLLVATFDRDGDATIYQDGEEVASTVMSGLGSMNSGFPIRLAQDGTGSYGSWFQGKIANSMIFDYALTPEQVGSLFDE